MTLTHLIDTDWVAHYFKGRPNIVARLHDLRGQGLGISVVTLAELYDGVYGARDPEAKERVLDKFLEWVTVVGLDAETAKMFGKERHRLRRAGNSIPDIDLLIGVTAAQHDLILLTNNRRHFERIEGIHIESLPVA